MEWTNILTSLAVGLITALGAIIVALRKIEKVKIDAQITLDKHRAKTLLETEEAKHKMEMNSKSLQMIADSIALTSQALANLRHVENELDDCKKTHELDQREIITNRERIEALERSVRG